MAHVSYPAPHAKIISALREAKPALQVLLDDCFLIGGAALVLAGIPLPHTPDIDLVTSARDAQSLLRFWRDKVVDYQPGSHDLFRSTFGRFRFEAMDIEVMGDLEVNQSGGWNKLQVEDYFVVETGGVMWKVATLEEQLRMLKLFGREKDLHRIDVIRQHQQSTF